MVQKTSSIIHFFFQDPSTQLRNRQNLKAFILLLLKKEKREIETLNYVFCTDQYLLQLNRKYLNHDFYTDTVSFELSKKGEPINGEIYISLDRVRENAKNLGVSFKSEIHRVMFHGLLHLCGYEDKNEKQRKLMRSKEDLYLHLYLTRFT